MTKSNSVKLLISVIPAVVHMISQSGLASESDLGLFFSQETMVETVTRHPKPLVDVAENISIVTAAQIESMNAHTLYEVLNRVPGLFVIFNGMDFGSDASLTIHGASGSDLHRVLVLLDGLRLNSTSNGKALLNSISVGIVERLEIIKGPASSSWGSAIGGVVNIITKSPVLKRETTASVSASYGEADSRDLRGELETSTDTQGYYFHLANQHSDGLRDNRYFDNQQLYGKASLQPFAGTAITLTAGSTESEWKSADFVQAGNRYLSDNRNGFATANLDVRLGESWIFNFGGGILHNDFTSETRVLGKGLLGVPGEKYFDQNWDERQINVSGRAVYSDGLQTLVFGVEALFEELDHTLSLGPSASATFGLTTYSPDIAQKQRYGIFLNDTLTLGDFVLTPGIRYDHDSLSDSFLSPSLGLVWKLSTNNRVRTTLARGFSSPSLTILKQSSPFFNPNENLDPENVVSIQAGIETKSIPYVLAKTTIFHHDIDNVWAFDRAARHYINSGSSERRGLDLELETLSWRGFSAAASFNYAKDNPDNAGSDDFYKISMRLRYDNPAVFTCELFGSHLHLLDREMVEGEDDTTIWDLNFSKTISIREIPVDFFVTIHNLTNQAQYWSFLYPNPDRWIEAGLRFTL